MKKIYFTIIFILVFDVVKSQPLPPLDNARGIYVNKLFELNRGSNVYNPGFSILGNTNRENELLQYCKDNHITYLVLYDMRKLFSTYGSSQWATNSGLLSSFICKAKTNYCIQKVGVALSDVDDIDLVDDFNNITTPPFNFNIIEQNLPEYSQLSFVNQSYSVGDDLHDIAEYTKMLLRIAFYSDPEYSISNNFCVNNNLDIITLEYEFWNDGYFRFTSNLNNPEKTFQGKIDKIDQVKPARRNLCASAMCAGGFRRTQYFKLNFSLNDFISLIQVM